MNKAVKATKGGLSKLSGTALWGLFGGVVVGLGIGFSYSSALSPTLFAFIIVSGAIAGIIFGGIMGDLVNTRYEIDIDSVDTHQQYYRAPVTQSSGLNDHLELRQQFASQDPSSTERVSTLTLRSRHSAKIDSGEFPAVSTPREASARLARH